MLGGDCDRVRAALEDDDVARAGALPAVAAGTSARTSRAKSR